MSGTATLRPIPPDTVRIWRGYRAADKDRSEFAAFLGSIFAPACALLQPRAGLCAYVPSLVNADGKPEEVPDQTALMFWADERAHDTANGTVAVRAYQNLHGGAYDVSRSSSATPVPYEGTVEPEKPYHLFDGPADWMLGAVHHFVGGPAEDSAAWLPSLARWASEYVATPPDGVDAALLCAGQGYLAFWEHSTDSGAPSSGAFERLGTIARAYLSKTAEPAAPGGGLWDQWPGWDLDVHDCMNVQLDRG